MQKPSWTKPNQTKAIENIQEQYDSAKKVKLKHWIVNEIQRKIDRKKYVACLTNKK